MRTLLVVTLCLNPLFVLLLKKKYVWILALVNTILFFIAFCYFYPETVKVALAIAVAVLEEE